MHTAFHVQNYTRTSPMMYLMSKLTRCASCNVERLGTVKTLKPPDSSSLWNFLQAGATR